MQLQIEQGGAENRHENQMFQVPLVFTRLVATQCVITRAFLSAIFVSYPDVLASLFTSDRFLKIERFPLTYHGRMRRRSRNQRLASNPERTRSNAGPSKAHWHCRTVPVSFAVKRLDFRRHGHHESQPRSASETTASSGASSVLGALSISAKWTS